jgi:DNA replication protein DnaC
MTESGRERPGEPLPPKVGLMTKTLLDGEFLDRRENLLAFGNPGSGKTHLLCAIGQELIAARAAGLLHNIGAAGRQARSETERFFKRLAYFEGLIIDDLGYMKTR